MVDFADLTRVARAFLEKRDGAGAAVPEPSPEDAVRVEIADPTSDRDDQGP